MRLASILAVLVLVACASEAPAPAAPPSKLVKTPAPPPNFAGADEEEAILRTVDSFLLAVGNHDTDAMKDLIVPEGTAFLQRRTKTETKPVARRANSEFLKPQPGADPFIERYWSPVVQVRGDIAMVWAPYELRDNGQVVHCGIDAFDMVKLDGKWRVGNLLSTMEPDACAELAPPSVAAMRPKDGWKETPNQ